MKYTNFHEENFRQSVDTALRSVERILHVDRNPHVAEEVDHSYGNKYDLANHVSNAAIIALVNVLEPLGLTAEALKALEESSTTTKTLRFQAFDTCEFIKERTVEVPAPRSLETTEETTTTGTFFGTTTKSSITKIVNHVKEFHWKVGVSWEISLYSGTNVEQRTILQHRSSSTIIVTSHTKRPPIVENSKTHPPIEVSLKWLLQQIDIPAMTAQFKINPQHTNTKTPRHNDDVQHGIQFMSDLSAWGSRVQQHFTRRVETAILAKHNPAEGGPATNLPRLDSMDANAIFCPLLPLLEEIPSNDDIQHEEKQGEGDNKESDNSSTPKSVLSSEFAAGNVKGSPLLSANDMHKLLNEQIRTLQDATKELNQTYPPVEDLMKLISVVEAVIVQSCKQMEQVSSMYENNMNYIELMLKNQLIAAIGKEVHSEDLDQFVKFHNAKWLHPAPQPFCHAIRRPRHYPDGLLSIESEKKDGKLEPIETLVRQVSDGDTSPLQVPLNAATTLELSGTKYLHGWVQHRFQSEDRKSYQLIARARQFSSFILMVGTMTGPNRMDPKEAIILQNKDELLIPLLLNELPTPKEFKDAIQSLSPEQQRFAKSFRSMQLESSVFGVCVIQIKPQLEALLGLPGDALTKEMKLTQDLMELFVEYQVPSDLLSYDGPSENEIGSTTAMTPTTLSMKDKVANVKGHVQAVLDVITSAKTKQLEENAMRADMAEELAVQSSGFRPPPGSSGGGMEAAHFLSAPVSLSSASVRSSGGMMPGMVSMQKMMRAPPRKAMASPMSRPVAPMENAMMSIQMDAPERHSRSSAPSRAPTKSVVPIAVTGNDPTRGADRMSAEKSVTSTPSHGGGGDAAVDFTCIPKLLDATMETHDKDNALRSTIVKASERWTRRRQENLLTKMESSTLNSDKIKTEKNKAFDLLDALSRSGSLAISCSELHVIVSVTHCFDNDVMGTVIQDNINPIEKLEKSTLLVASTIYGVPVRELVADATQLQRLTGSFPALFDSPASETTADS